MPSPARPESAPPAARSRRAGRGRGWRLGALLAGTAWAVPAMADPAAVARGAAIVASRSQGLCVLCHALPGQPAAQQGTIGPTLAGVGARLDRAQLRERLLAPERSQPDTVMPAYGRTDGLQRVAPGLRGQALLTPQQIDDVVAWLADQR